MKLIAPLILFFICFSVKAIDTDSIDYYQGDVKINFADCEWILPKQKLDMFVGNHGANVHSVLTLDKNREIVYPIEPSFDASFLFEPTKDLVEQVNRYKHDSSSEFTLTKEKLHRHFLEVAVDFLDSNERLEYPFRRLYFWGVRENDKTASLLVSGVSDRHWKFMLDHCKKTYKK